MNPYYYLFYIIYKFVKLTAKEEHQDQVPSSALASFFFGFTNFLLAIIILINPFKYISYSLPVFGTAFIFINILFYLINRKILIKDKKYLEIENHYDKTNKLEKKHFILIAALYMLGSVGLMIWAGINYTG
jgi:uncharacterized BrkB/YihY/UPF0761 family membrane protein